MKQNVLKYQKNTLMFGPLWRRIRLPEICFVDIFNLTIFMCAIIDISIHRKYGK